MRSLVAGSGACLVLASAFLGSHQSCGQAPTVEKVRFDTVDRVTIRGTFYASSKGTKAPCALLLHPIGDGSGRDGWEPLAKRLQQKGFAVLAFDFRGHGDSKEIDPDTFWKFPHNLRLKGHHPARPRSEINYQEFASLAHYLTLANDIAAARRYLDTRSDNQECNSSNIAVIAADNAAALGVLWIATEWIRNVEATPAIPVPRRGRTGGQDVMCAVWLGLNPNMGAYRVPVESWLRNASVKEKVPMYFLFGADDPRMERFVQGLFQDTLRAKTDKKVSKLTRVEGVEGTKLGGRDLLTKGLKTEGMILDYLDKVIAENGLNPHERRDVSKIPLYPVPFERFYR